MPTTFDGSAQSGILAQVRDASIQDDASATIVRDIPVRGAMDMDDFSGGFGLWSGTSFSAPYFAGELAQKLVAERSQEKFSSVMEPGGDQVAHAINVRSITARALVDLLCKERGPR